MDNKKISTNEEICTCKFCREDFAERDMMFNVPSAFGICDACWQKADEEDKEYYNGVYIQQ